MKKLLLSIAFVISFSFSLYSGAFSVNFTVLNTNLNKIEEVVSNLNLDAYITYKSESDIIINICEKISDNQDAEYGISLAKTISEKTESPVLYSLIHDSDILYLNLVKSSSTVFEYNSWPGYFDGEEQKPEIVNIKALEQLFLIDSKVLEPLLMLTDGKEYVFAEELFLEILNSLKLPDFICTVSYRYINENETQYRSMGIKFERFWKK